MKEEDLPCAAVCGDEVRIYGEREPNGVRPLLKVRRFAHYGAAVLFAQEYDEDMKKSMRRPGAR